MTRYCSLPHTDPAELWIIESPGRRLRNPMPNKVNFSFSWPCSGSCPCSKRFWPSGDLPPARTLPPLDNRFTRALGFLERPTLPGCFPDYAYCAHRTTGFFRTDELNRSRHSAHSETRDWWCGYPPPSHCGLLRPDPAAQGRLRPGPGGSLHVRISLNPSL